MEEATGKKCKGCGETKPLDQYYKYTIRGKVYYRYLCIGCYSVRNKSVHLRDKEKHNETNRLNYQSHKDEYKARAKRWKKNNPEKNSESGKKSYYAHREREIKRTMSYRARNRTKIAIIEQNRRFQKINSKNRLSESQWVAILDFYGHRCLKCGSTYKITIDHVIPLSMGGEHTPANVQPLCAKCNSSKCNRTRDDYRPDGGEFARSMMTNP